MRKCRTPDSTRHRRGGSEQGHNSEEQFWAALTDGRAKEMFDKVCLGGSVPNREPRNECTKIRSSQRTIQASRENFGQEPGVHPKLGIPTKSLAKVHASEQAPGGIVWKAHHKKCSARTVQRHIPKEECCYCCAFGIIVRLMPRFRRLR